MLEQKKKLHVKSENYLSILEVIKSKNHNSRLVGGVVRDAILGIDSEDIDIATSMLPEEVMKVFSSLGYKVIPTGIRFGTVSVLHNGELFEITTLRKDISSDGRYSKVEYTDDFYLDALRRDFTINALSYCPFEEKIFDYFGGIKDLQSGLVRFIGDADLRIKEDYLRILRFFRFFGKFGNQIDQNSLNFCIKNKSFIKNLSRERIKSEFDLILKLPNYSDVITLMDDKSILQEILPISDLKLDKFIDAKNIASKFDTYLTNETKYALLFALGGGGEYAQLVDLKFSRIEARIITDLLSMLLNRDNINECFLKEIWLEKNNFSQCCIFLASMFQVEKEIEGIFWVLKDQQKPVFPVNGNDLLSLGISSVMVGKELTYIKRKWIASDFTLTKQDLINIAKKNEK